jgi:hypothetical protein
MYDNFTLPQGNGLAWNLQSIHWIGGYDETQAHPITAWNVGIYDDNGGQPGNLMFGMSFPGTGNETFVSNINGFLNYIYWVYPTDATLNPGTQYWLALYPDLGFPPQWFWSTGFGGDGISYQDFFGTRYQLDGIDMNFALDGVQSTSEPGTLIMLGTGALCLAGTLRRKLL